jgi:biopolymer transport protein ExbB
MLSYEAILTAFGNVIYVALGAAAIYGVFLVILLMRRVAQKRFSSLRAEAEFSETVREYLRNKDFESVASHCDSPALWNKAAPQLILLAISHPELSINKLRQLLAEKFERDILADIEYRTSWVATIVKSAPMLGLLGTVVGMINAFGKIASMKQTGMDATALANDISFALFTTAMGLAVAIPLVLAGAALHVRIGKLQDSVQQVIGDFLADWDEVRPRKEIST